MKSLVPSETLRAAADPPSTAKETMPLKPPRHLTAGELVAGMSRQAGVEDRRHFGMLAQPFGDRLGVGHMLAHAHAQRADAPNQQPAIEGARYGTEVVLPVGDARAQLGRARDDGAADQVAVAAQVLGGAVDHQVDAPVDRLLAVGRGEGVVDDGQRACRAADVGERAQVHDVEQRVGRRLDPDHAGVGANRGAALLPGRAGRRSRR